ncbi:response regulator [Pedobacter sp.]|uniref:response regulator n=1 Tax=Pedobacter sp. TaxID=1411316 RepID=UPI003D7F500E
MTTIILIIEDSTDIRERTAEILELAGYIVYQASNGRQGVELAIKYVPDLILCDVMLPELDGYGVLHMLSKREETSLIPFVFITAKTELSDMREGMETDAYITKPFNDMELMHIIESRLQKSANEKRLLSQSDNQINSLFSSSSGLDALKQCFSECKVRSLKKKQVVYYEGDTANAIYLVLSGTVKTLKIAEDGRELMTAVYGPEEYFGITAMLAGKEYQETAETIEDCTLCSLPKEIVDQLVYKYSDVAERFIKILACNLLQNQEQLLQLAYYSVRKRMAELLVRLHNKNRQNKTLQFSRDNLAALAGMATETVSRVISDFKEEGLIDRIAGGIIILEPHKLQRIKN